MDSVLRAAVIYLALMLILRMIGKRTMAQVTTFDFILLLIISEATQQALLANDFSFTNALLVIGTLVGVDRTADYLQWRWPLVARLTQGEPIVLVHDGKPFDRRMAKEHVSIEDVLERARSVQGLENLEQIKFAVLERSGGISIIPRDARAG